MKTDVAERAIYAQVQSVAMKQPLEQPNIRVQLASCEWARVTNGHLSEASQGP
jgi:hypothetical protein